MLNLLQKRVLPRYGWFFVVYIQSWSLQTFQYVVKGKKNVLFSRYRYYLSSFGTIAISHIKLIEFGVYHTELLLLWVSKSRWQVTTRIKVIIFWFWTLFCHFHTVKLFAIVPESSYSKKVLFSQFWVRFCCIRILFSSNTMNIWFNQKKVLNLLQKRVFPRYWWSLSYWVATFVSVKIALTSN